MGYRVRQGTHFYPVSFNTLNLFDLKYILRTQRIKYGGETEADYRY